VGDHERVANNIECVRPIPKCLECRRNIVAAPDFEIRRIEAQSTRRGLNLRHFQRGGGILDVRRDRQPAQTGHDFTQELDAFTGDICRLKRQPGDVPAWSCQTCDQAHADWVVHQREYNRDYRRRLFCGERRVSTSDNDVHLELGEFGCHLGQALCATVSPTVLDRDGAPVDPAEFVQTLQKSSSPRGPRGCRRRPKVADSWELCRLLRARRERPHGRAAE
jgi:hypothetical protein